MGWGKKTMDLPFEPCDVKCSGEEQVAADLISWMGQWWSGCYFFLPIRSARKEVVMPQPQEQSWASPPQGGNSTSSLVYAFIL